MMAQQTEESTYYIILRSRSKCNELLYNIGDERDVTTVIKLCSKNTDKIFNYVVSTLAKHGAIVPMRVSSNESVYSVREDLGPVVGAYLLMMRRARDIDRWGKLFTAVVDGQYAGVAIALTMFLELAIELSRRTARNKQAAAMLDALTSALKVFIDKAVRDHKP